MIIECVLFLVTYDFIREQLSLMFSENLLLKIDLKRVLNNKFYQIT